MDWRKMGGSFRAKLVAALLLALLADRLVLGPWASPAAAIFATALLAALLVLRFHRLAWAPFTGAAALALLLFEDASLLAWMLFLTMLGLAVLLPRMRRFDDALAWAGRLALLALHSAGRPVADLQRLGRAWRRSGGVDWLRLVALLALPMGGGLLFLWLFTLANPVLQAAFARIRIDWPVERLFLHGFVCAVALLLAWGFLRPGVFRLRMRGIDAMPAAPLPGFSPASVFLSLLLFNALFAVQNLLDILFLWSGAALPDGVTLADYAHRGAYLLIVTALLAGLFVLLAFRPGAGGQGADGQGVGRIRWLVVLWIAQNLLLVASSMLRTIDYVEAYSLTILRISALLWMALVGVGLVLICWRLLAGHSSRWLINANAAAALAVLGLCSVVDLGEVAARWNVRHAREVGGSGPQLDLCYLENLGPSAVRPLVELAARLGGRDDAFADQVRHVSHQAIRQTARAQQDIGWSLRNERRLAFASEVVIASPKPLPQGYIRLCGGEIEDFRIVEPAPAAPEMDAAPLTAEAAQ